MPSCLFLAALWSAAERGGLLALLCVCVFFIVALPRGVPVKCGALLYHFLIFALFTLKKSDLYNVLAGK